MQKLEHTTLIPGRSPTEVFEFCLDGANFAAIFPEPVYRAGQTRRTSLRIEAGREFDFWQMMFGFVPLRWRMCILEVVPNQCFTDAMLSGPMRSFVHRHSVERAGNGTLYTDQVTYEAPGGGWLERKFVRPYMERLFFARQRNMHSLLAREH